MREQAVRVLAAAGGEVGRSLDRRVAGPRPRPDPGEVRSRSENVAAQPLPACGCRIHTFDSPRRCAKRKNMSHCSHLDCFRRYWAAQERCSRNPLTQNHILRCVNRIAACGERSLASSSMRAGEGESEPAEQVEIRARLKYGQG